MFRTSTKQNMGVGDVREDLQYAKWLVEHVEKVVGDRDKVG